MVETTAARPLWAHQSRGIADAFAREAQGFKAICVTCPTGGGKRTMLARCVQRTVEEGGRAVVWTNRRLITAQTLHEFAGYGIDYGVLAGGYSSPLGQPALIASVQTAQRRSDFPGATRVFIDEAHNHAFDVVVKHYRAKGVPVHGYTATPVGLGDLYETLVVAGTPSELRRCGALVPCRVYSPEQPYLKGVKRKRTGEFVDAQLRQLFGSYQTEVFANVLDWWEKLNPWHQPTLLWAPGVPESRWFVEEFKSRGVPAAHLDGETDEDERKRILDGSKSGEIKVVSSYGVLREGADMPWVTHGILVQVCGALSTFLQIAGRLLRAFPGKSEAVLQDHSGAYWRHLSPNMDRLWKLGDTDLSIAKALHKARQEGKEPEPIRCPQCGGERVGGPRCPFCSFESEKSVRLVRMTDGTLKKQTGNLVKRKKQVSEDVRAWTGCLYAAAFRGRTLAQARGDFYRRTKRPLPHGLPRCPPDGSPDWERRAADVYPELTRRKRATP